MVKQYTTKIAIAKSCSAISNISRTWDECWQAFLDGDYHFEDADDVDVCWPKTAPISKVGARAGWDKQPPFYQRYRALVRMVGEDLRAPVDAIINNNKDVRVTVLLGTCHSDAGVLSTIVNCAHGKIDGLSEEMQRVVLKSDVANSFLEGLGRRLPMSIVSAACASSLVAASYAADMIDAGLCDVVVIPSADILARVACAGFSNIKAMTKDVCKPYDVSRTGTTVGEGAAGFILAREGILPPDEVYGHIAGTSIYCDAAHLVEPNVEGICSVLLDAIQQAGITTDDIAAIYWHGTGTQHNDRTESEVASLLFGELSPPCTSTKGSLGHTMGASGAYNVLAACETNRTGIIPHVASLKEQEYPNLAVVQGAPQKIEPGPILITALGFGGINAAVVVTP